MQAAGDTAEAVPGAVLKIMEGMGHDLPQGEAWAQIARDINYAHDEGRGVKRVTPMHETARPQVIQAVHLIRSHFNLMLIPAAVIGISYLSFLVPQQVGGLLAFGSVLATLILYPLMYGRFTEIITGQRPVPWGSLLRRHWLNFISVSIVLHAPLFLWLLLVYSLQLGVGAGTDLIYALVNILGIYVIPLVFLTGERFSCIPLGIKCLVGNFQFSLPLVVLSILSILFGAFVGHGGAGSPPHAPSAFVGLLVILLTVAVDFLVFVAAGLVLKEKLFQDRV